VLVKKHNKYADHVETKWERKRDRRLKNK